MNATLDVLWVAGVGGFALTALLMPLVVRGWNALGRRDREVSLRKVHQGEVPRAGGLVMLFAFGAMVLLGLAGVTELSATHELLSVTPLSGGLLGAAIVALTGLYDDLVGMRARTKLLFQIVAVAVAILYGVHWPALELLIGWEYHWLATLLTALFILAAVNALNLMDGLDGLAGGLALLGLCVVTSSIVANGPVVTPEQLATGWISTTALGVVAGFLIHNRHPAAVFMGDAGAYFLGFLLAVLMLEVEPVRWRVPELQLSIPLLVFTVPLFDMGMAILRRAIRGQPLFSSDSDHVHHRLLAAGLSHRRAVIVLWLTAGMFSTLAFLNVIGVGGWWTLLGTLSSLVIASVLLGYHRLLGQLPAFTGKRFVGWRDRRREVMEVLGHLERLRSEGPQDFGPARWVRLRTELGILLAGLGVPAFEIWSNRTEVTTYGDPERAWAWLTLPIPGQPAGEIRLALAVRLPDLQAEQLMLIERIVATLARTGETLRGATSTASIRSDG